MNKVTLFSYKHPEIEIHIQAYVNQENDLIIDGCDIGSRVKEIGGESDYEYAYRIKSDSVKHLKIPYTKSFDNNFVISSGSLYYKK